MSNSSNHREFWRYQEQDCQYGHRLLGGGKCFIPYFHWIDEKSELLAALKPFNAALGAAEEYAIECAMLKVYGEEVLTRSG
jgi:hypothetical protein